MLLTLGQLGMKHPSLEGMSAALPTRISREALHQRFTAPAAAFLRGCLQEVLQAKLPPLPVETKLLHPFGHVWVVDSSSWGVREELRAVLPGSGGNASNANCKIQLAYDYKQGDLMFLEETACRLCWSTAFCVKLIVLSPPPLPSQCFLMFLKWQI